MLNKQSILNFKDSEFEKFQILKLKNNLWTVPVIVLLLLSLFTWGLIIPFWYFAQHEGLNT